MTEGGCRLNFYFLLQADGIFGSFCGIFGTQMGLSENTKSAYTYFVSFILATKYIFPDGPHSNSTAHGSANVAMNCPKFLNADVLTKRDESFSKLNSIGAKTFRRISIEQLIAILGRDFAVAFRTPHTLSSQRILKIGNCNRLVGGKKNEKFSNLFG